MGRGEDKHIRCNNERRLGKQRVRYSSNLTTFGYFLDAAVSIVSLVEAEAARARRYLYLLYVKWSRGRVQGKCWWPALLLLPSPPHCQPTSRCSRSTVTEGPTHGRDHGYAFRRHQRGDSPQRLLHRSDPTLRLVRRHGRVNDRDGRMSNAGLAPPYAQPLG